MMLNGWLASFQCYVVILAILYLSGLFSHIAIDCSSTEVTLPLANEVRDQGRYCVWSSYDQSVLNFKEQDVPIALIFTIDHNLTPIKLKQVLDTYHAVACLLPNDSNYLYAAVLHLPKNPKLYFGKISNTQKLHQSLEDAGEAIRDDRKIRNDSCNLIRQTINVINNWLKKAFFFEKVIKHIILINDRADRCIISKYLHEIYHKGHNPHRWLVDRIILNATKIIHSQYRLERRNNIAEQLKDNKNRNIFDGTRLLLSNQFNETQNEFLNKTIIKESLIEFLREIIFESVIADAIFGMDLADNWIKYDFEDFKKRSQQLITYESWTWLLNILRVMFFLLGAFVVLITTCALCGFSCILSSILRDDYYRRRQMREREEELRIIEERLHEAEINIRFDASSNNPINDRPELEREGNSGSNTAIEQLSMISEADLTQSSTITSDSEAPPYTALSS